MQLMSFSASGRNGWGLAEGGAVIDLTSPDYPTLLSAIASGALADVVARQRPDGKRLALADICFAPVIPNPGKIFCIGHNYESHRQETGRDKTDYPSVFIRFADSQVGHAQPLVRPAASTMFDYEGELALVIGKGGRAIPHADALDHIAGYSCFNDASVRDWQWHTKQFTPGKNFPGTGAFGPFLVTPDEVGDPATLSVTTRVNGQVLQDQPTSDLIFPIPVLINYISSFTPLSPGDVIVTGTPGGVGAKRQPPIWLTPGDVVKVSIPRVGQLVNAVVDE